MRYNNSAPDPAASILESAACSSFCSSALTRRIKDAPSVATISFQSQVTCTRSLIPAMPPETSDATFTPGLSGRSILGCDADLPGSSHEHNNVKTARDRKAAHIAN